MGEQLTKQTRKLLLGYQQSETVFSIYASVLPHEDGEIAKTMGSVMSENKV